MKSYTAFIFARGGSKGLPGKNIKVFQGIPLISRSIEHAKEIERINRIIVSTDSPEIAEVALASGAEVPFMRPVFLAADTSSEIEAWKHALKFLGEMEGTIPDTLVSIPVTSPLRLPIDIDNCIDEFESGIHDVVVGVTDSNRNPFYNMLIKNENSEYQLAGLNTVNYGGRQQAPKVYSITTVCYAARSEYIMKANSILEGKIGVFHVPPERAIDIDTQLDFDFANFLATRGVKIPND